MKKIEVTTKRTPLPSKAQRRKATKVKARREACAEVYRVNGRRVRQGLLEYMRTSKGSGRRSKDGVQRVRHGKREAVSPKVPLLVTVKRHAGLPSLRRPKAGQVLVDAMLRASRKPGFRLVHYVIMDDHLHLIVEGDDRASVSGAMQGLAIETAKQLGKLWGRSGSVWADRYHDRALGTPTEVRNAIRYVLLNASKHTGRPQRFAERRGEHRADPYSSGSWFDHWVEEVTIWEGFPPESPFSRPESWLLAGGWKEAPGGRISLYEVPGSRR